jgi:hypothetical protein
MALTKIDSSMIEDVGGANNLVKLDANAKIPAGTGANLLNKPGPLTSASDPTVSSNKTLGTEWLNSTSGEMYICTDATAGANVWTNVGAGTSSIAPAYNIDYLVIAGGGASGKGGVEPGAGAGGLRTSWAGGSGGGGVSESQLTLIPTTVYTITVGAGGAGSSSAFNSGADSVISGTGLTTVTSLGGGYSCQHGSSAPDVGANGGCGGGGKNAGTYGSGTANQGYDGSVRISGNYPLGGGGGTDEAGGTDQAGDGGDGKQVNIDGNNYYWGGGGGSGGHNGQSGGVWGWGGDGGLGGGGGGSGDFMGTTFGAGGGSAINSGGTGVDGNHPGGAGGANSGGGAGGGSDSNSTSASGGSGCVILRMTTSSYSGTTSGSPTITTIGSDTILTFTGSGTYTA